MTYMTAHDAQPTQPDCPPVRGQYLNFDAKRAGRAVADLHLENVRHLMILPYNAYTVALGTTCDVTFGEPLGGLFAWWDWDAHDLALLCDAEAEPLAIGSEHIEDQDTDLVQWFIDGEAEAKESLRGGSFAAQHDPEPSGEPIRTLRDGLRSQSWRGGGTMHRR